MDLKFAADDAGPWLGCSHAAAGRLYRDVVIEAELDEQATAAGIRAALEEVATRARPQDTLVVFLAGHGDDGRPARTTSSRTSSRRNRDGSDLESDIRAQGLPADTLADWEGTVPALKRVLVLDTCHSGGAVGIAQTGRSPIRTARGD